MFHCSVSKREHGAQRTAQLVKVSLSLRLILLKKELLGLLLSLLDLSLVSKMCERQDH